MTWTDTLTQKWHEKWYKDELYFNHFKSPLNTHSLNTQTNGPSPFASSFSSPSLENDSNMLSLATLNIKGYKDATKFSSILSDIQHKNLTLVGLTETHLPAATTSILFWEYWSSQKILFK